MSGENHGGADLPSLREDLIMALRREGALKPSGEVEAAIRSVPREEFIWPGTPKFTAYFDEPQPLGSTGQTISAPHIVALMLEELELSPGLKVLEIGGGSGYNAALIGHIVSARSKETAPQEPLVISVERGHELAEFAKANLMRVGLAGVVRVIEGDGSLGYPQQSCEELYDRIVVAAGAPRVPIYLRRQLKVGGIMIIPIGGINYQKLTKITKKEGARPGAVEFHSREIIDCMFVPLVGSDAHS